MVVDHVRTGNVFQLQVKFSKIKVAIRPLVSRRIDARLLPASRGWG
jgi:hypothetical protein